jgi:hypothetical protein
MSKQIKKKIANGTGHDKHRKGGDDLKQECSHTATSHQPATGFNRIS